MDQCDVLIVGAGPTGLFLASELTRYGLSCRIVDKNSGPSDKSKALAIQPRTLEILSLVGLESDFLEQGHKLRAMHPMGNGKQLGEIDFSILDSPFPFILSLPQEATERILIKHLPIDVERETELIGLREEGDQMIATLQRSQKFELSAKWVVGCDGAHSFVRRKMDLSFLGRAFPEVFSLADVEMEWKYPHEEGRVFLNSKGILAAIPLPQKDLYRLIFQLDRCQNQGAPSSVDNLHVELPPPTLDEVKEKVEELADPDAQISAPRWLANFHVNSRLTSCYQKGKLFLAGDAAHIHSPIGGQGMNTGLQDAFNLAWKMALVHKGEVSPKVLDTYHTERHAIARSLLKRTEIATRMATLKKGTSLRSYLLSLLLKISSLRKRVIRSMTQLSIRYPKGLLASGKGKLVGMRAPSCPLVDDLLKNPTGFTVLLFAGEKGDLEQVELPFPTTIITDREVHRLFGMDKGGACVIRPDGYIGYSQSPLDLRGLIDKIDQYVP